MHGDLGAPQSSPGELESPEQWNRGAERERLGEASAGPAEPRPDCST